MPKNFIFYWVVMLVCSTGCSDSNFESVGPAEGSQRAEKAKVESGLAWVPIAESSDGLQVPSDLEGLVGPQDPQEVSGTQGSQGATGAMSAPGIITAIYTAQQSGGVRVTGLQWTSLPGTTVSFTLAADSTVDLEANGSIFGIAGNQGNAAHCGFRFLVDNVAYGDPSWGDVIVGCGSGTNSHAGWWCPWTMRRTLQLRAGNHFATVQQSGWASTTSGCESSAADYSATRFRIVSR